MNRPALGLDLAVQELAADALELFTAMRLRLVADRTLARPILPVQRHFSGE